MARKKKEDQDMVQKMRVDRDSPKYGRGEKIIMRRKRLGMLQKEVADVLGMSRAGYSLYETGVNDMAIDQLPVIAAKLGVGVSFFFDDDTWRGPLVSSTDLARIQDALPQSKDQDELAAIAEAIADLPPDARHEILMRASSYVAGLSVGFINPIVSISQSDEEEGESDDPIINKTHTGEDAAA